MSKPTKRGTPAPAPERKNGESQLQPVSRVQWLDPSRLHANNYNPNHVAPAELELLKLSILSDGWTQPIVVLPDSDGEIVDGFHRWTLGMNDAQVRALTGGLVPVVELRPGKSRADQMAATIRHNRARGSHAVLRMAEIVREMASGLGVPEAEIMQRLGMEDEEVSRLLDASGMPVRGASSDFGTGWAPDTPLREGGA